VQLIHAPEVFQKSRPNFFQRQIQVIEVHLFVLVNIRAHANRVALIGGHVDQFELPV
jgi:hypothetical protein